MLEVSGRTYPVEVRYRPLADPDRPESEPRDQIQGITDAVGELRAEGPGDILVFLSGEREIRDTADALGDVPGIEVLPLYARLSAAEQYRVFQPHAGRRVVLATNVAETSLTVPGIRYVVDPGTARISRYSQRTKVQRLPIEAVSQASANQRTGRCGRTSDGICIRLYTEDDFAGRPEFTDPEILRTNLASVILRMAALDLGAMADFPFVDPPDARNVTDGVRLLEELGAIRPGTGSGGESPRLTETGRKLADLPVDPRLGPDDPRVRPERVRPRGAHHHRRAVHPGPARTPGRPPGGRGSGAPPVRRAGLGLPHLRHALGLRARPAARSCPARRSAGCAAGSTCTTCGYASGRTSTASCARPPATWASSWAATNAARPPRAGRRSQRPRAGTTADLADRVHQSLLAGLLSHLGLQDPDRQRRPGGAVLSERRRGPAEFLGARGARFAIFPDSPLARKPPPWVMAAELVETSRLWARTVARIEPEWAEQLGGDLLRRSYSEPRWDARRGAVLATEKVSLYGLPIVADRSVNYGRIDPAAARDLFIQHALVERDWETHHQFFRHNEEVLAQAAEARGQGAPPRHRRRRPRHLRLLRRPDPGDSDLGAALRLLVEEGQGADDPSC